MRPRRGRLFAGRRAPGFAALLGALALLLTGCQHVIGGQARKAAPGQASTMETISQALTDLSEAGALHVTAALTTLAGDKVTVDAQVTATGEALGALTMNGQRAQVVVLDKTPYLKGPAAFWAALPGIPDAKSTVVADRWVSVPTALLGVQIEDLFGPQALAQVLGAGSDRVGNRPVAQNPHQRVGRADAIAVETSAGTVLLSAAGPHRVVGAKLASVGRAGPAAVRDLTLTVADATDQLGSIYQQIDTKAGQLGSPVDLITPVQEGSHRFADCMRDSCAIIVELTNNARVAVRVSVSANWIGDGRPLGRCDTEAGPVPPGQQVSATCTISSAQWTAFYDRAHSVQGQHPYSAEWSAVGIASPPDAKAVHAHAEAAANPPDPTTAARQGSYFVYTLDHQGTGNARDTWKYGVVPAGYARDQAAQQLSACQRSSGLTCGFRMVTATNDPAAAYAVQHRLLQDYRARARHCPAGQVVDCA